MSLHIPNQDLKIICITDINCYRISSVGSFCEVHHFHVRIVLFENHAQIELQAKSDVKHLFNTLKCLDLAHETPKCSHLMWS